MASIRVRRLATIGVGLLVGMLGLTQAANAEARLAEAVERARAATVGILGERNASSSSFSVGPFTVKGSGVHIRDGFVLTARHAVERLEGSRTVIPEHIAVLTHAFDELQAELVGFNGFLDLAVYHLNELPQDGQTPALPRIPFGGEEPRPGDRVFTVGYPLGWGPTVAFGGVGNPNTFLPTAQTRLVQVDLSVCSGNSGGGMFNADGELVGLIHAIIQTESLQAERRCSRLGFSVPGPLVRRIALALIEGERVVFPRFGIRMSTVKVGSRWRVSVVKATGPARAGGLRKGDILLAIDNQEIASAAHFKQYLIEHTVPGQRVSVKILRKGAQETFVVTLGAL